MRFDQDTGWWFPGNEAHLQEWMLKVKDEKNGRLVYQGHKYRAALEFVPPDRRRVAVDIGAHVGLWSWQMARDFKEIAAFEPVALHRQCWVYNMEGTSPGRYELHEFALGDSNDRMVTLTTRTPDSTGDTGVDPQPNPDEPMVPMRTLDSFALPVVDFIKIDCEGYELFVLRGAEATLTRHRPIVVVEQKPETGMEARYGISATAGIDFLKGLGAVVLAGIQGDYIMGWR